MKKSTKGAFAAAAAGSLLLGGAGSLAYWTDAAKVNGTDIRSGHLKLVDAECGDGWTLDGDLGTYDATTQLIVPGDTLTQTCTYKVDIEGSHLAASFDVSQTKFAAANKLTVELLPSAVFKVNGRTVTPGATADIKDNDILTAVVSVNFDGVAATNGSNSLTGLSAHLDNITVTATQRHEAPVAVAPPAQAVLAE
jgi:alternate signal-mediated exported protein